MSQMFIAIIILILVIISFATQIIPLPLTAILGSLAMMAAGIITPDEAISAFGSDTVMMVAGVIIVGNAVFETGFADRIGNAVFKIKAVQNSERVFLLVIMTMITILSAFISNSAAIAMFMPLVSSIAKASNGKIQKKNCYMGMAIASIVGGFCTLSGSSPQLVAQELLNQTDGLRGMTYFELAKIGIPIVLLMLLYFGTIGYQLQKKCFTFPETNYVEIPAGKQAKAAGHKDIIAGAILLLCVTGFVSGIFSFGTVALLGACACILTGCICLNRVYETMDWSTLIVLGGSIGFAKGMEKSGTVGVIANLLVEACGNGQANPAIVCAVLIFIAAVLSNVMSNTATVALLVPLAIDVALNMGVDPIIFVISIVVAGNLAFTTPISTPPMTMILVGGYRFSDYVKVGGLFNLIAVIFAMVLIPIIYGL